jgi:recombinational DNA repair protein RecR
MSTVKADQQLLKEQVKQAQQSTEKMRRCRQCPALLQASMAYLCTSSQCQQYLIMFHAGSEGWWS